MVEEPTRPKGLSIGSKAPLFNLNDIDGNNINLSQLLNQYKGVLIDFFRGNW